MLLLLQWIILYLVVLYALTIVSLWLRHRVPVHQRYEPYRGAPPIVPAETLAALAEKGRDLVDAGFRDLGLITHTRPDGASVLARCHDRPDGAITAVALAAVRMGRQARGGVFLNLVTEFADGFRLSTNNASYNTPMRRDPTGIIHQFPGVESAADLVALHEKLVQRRGVPIQPRLPGQDPSRFFGDRVDAEMIRQRELGGVRLSADTATYRLTLIGAATMAWLALPPSAAVLRMLLRRRAHRLRTRLEAE